MQAHDVFQCEKSRSGAQIPGEARKDHKKVDRGREEEAARGDGGARVDVEDEHVVDLAGAGRACRTARVSGPCSQKIEGLGLKAEPGHKTDENLVEKRGG